MAVSHVFSSPIADGTNTQLVRPSNWNSAHNFFQTISGNTAGQSTFSGTNMVLQGGDNVTLSANTAAGAATLIISAAAGAGGGAALQGSGTYTQNTGTVQFANSNGVTFGLSNNGVMTASVVPGGGSPFSAGISGGNTSGNTGTVSNQIVFAGGNNVTVSGSTNAGGMSVTISGANTVAQSVQPVAYSAANGSANFSTLTFANSNGVSFSTGTQGLYATVATDYAASNHSHDLATTTTNGSQVVVATKNSAGATVAIPPFITTFTPQSAMGFSGSNGSFTASTLSFGASNGLTFYTTNGSIVGSYTDAGAGGGDGYNIVQAGTTGTTGTTWSALSASVYLNGSNGMIVSQNNSNQIVLDGSNFATAVHLEGNTSGASSIQIQGQAMHWCGGNDITLSANGSSVTISNGYLAEHVMMPTILGVYTLNQVQNTLASVQYFPFTCPASWTAINVPLSINVATAANNSSAGINVSVSYVLASRNGSTINSIASTTWSQFQSWSSNNTGNVTGGKFASTAWNSSTKAGDYYHVLLIQTAATGGGLTGANTTSLGNTVSVHIASQPVNISFGNFGAASAGSTGFINAGQNSSTGQLTNMSLSNITVAGNNAGRGQFGLELFR